MIRHIKSQSNNIVQINKYHHLGDLERFPKQKRQKCVSIQLHSILEKSVKKLKSKQSENK
jgi:hypothetical protein